MLGMTAATVAWWTSLERAAPVAMTPVEAQLVVSGALMAVASAVACVGSVSAPRSPG
jgi:ABC-type proline/glycine betaine transport system permease subunit